MKEKGVGKETAVAREQSSSQDMKRTKCKAPVFE